MAEITVCARVVGRKSVLMPEFSVPVPPEAIGGGEPLTLRDLITRIVANEVDRFRQRQQNGKFIRVLSPATIQDGVEKGRVFSGGRNLNQEVDLDIAVGVALQAFEDGLYLVLLDGEQQHNLDAPVHLKEDSQVVFLRLVMLAGGF